MEKSPKGFFYTVDWEQIQKYRSWSPERKLQWLLLANKVRRTLPRKTIELQESFRKGKI